ncbi:MAG: tRNA and rRNA cytosine-C5-methylase, partial [Clostridiales bacterium]|nr:tRNA and rRNA cytosine-C5-methylase [Clostridiales bacterium]
DRVLVDAPCSGEGMLRREPAALTHWSPENVAACALRQGKILDSAALAVRPGGWLCYSTCTFAPEENEGTAAAFLARHPDFYLEDIQAHNLGQPGRKALAPDCPAVDKTRRIFPRMGGEGHFVALFRRREDTCALQPAALPQRSRPKPGKGRPQGRAASAGEAAALVAAFWKENLEGTPPSRLERRGDKLYLPPADCPPMDGLRLLRIGLLAGELAGHRFVPAHALFASPAVRPQRALELSLEAPLLTAYLRGEEIDAGPLSDGYAALRVCGLPLGFGKVSGGRLKNHYPKGLRLRG